MELLPYFKRLAKWTRACQENPRLRFDGLDCQNAIAAEARRLRRAALRMGGHTPLIRRAISLSLRGLHFVAVEAVRERRPLVD